MKTLFLGDYDYEPIGVDREQELEALIANLRAPGYRGSLDLVFDELLVATYAFSNPQEDVFLLYKRDGVLYEANIDQSSDQGWLMDEDVTHVDVLLHRLDNGTITGFEQWDMEIAEFIRANLVQGSAA